MHVTPFALIMYATEPSQIVYCCRASQRVRPIMVSLEILTIPTVVAPKSGCFASLRKEWCNYGKLPFTAQIRRIAKNLLNLKRMNQGKSHDRICIGFHGALRLSRP